MSVFKIFNPAIFVLAYRSLLLSDKQQRLACVGVSEDNVDGMQLLSMKHSPMSAPMMSTPSISFNPEFDVHI